MSPEILKQEAEMLLHMMGISTKGVRIVTDTDLKMTIVSLRVGKDRELFSENNNELTRSFGLIYKGIIKKKYYFYNDMMLDINGEDIQHINFTKQQAEIASERVRFFEKPYEFGYLNAFDRMIIHTYLKTQADILTESVGVGSERRLVISKKPLV